MQSSANVRCVSNIACEKFHKRVIFASMNSTNKAGNSSPDQEGGREGRFKFGGGAGSWAGVGFQFAATIVVFAFLGQWLDRKLGTGWLIVAGVLLGMTAGIYSMYRRLMAEQKREAEAKQQRESAQRGK